jgi:hypothetical protein
MASKHLQTIAHGLILIAVMLGAIAAALWFRSDGLESKAQAQGRAVAAARDEAGLPDAGRQRYQMVEELQQLNRRVADLERGLRDGAFAIRTIEAKPAPTPSPKDEAKETQR